MPYQTRGGRSALLLLALLLVLPVRARCQVVTGRALDAESGQPLTAAMVLLLDETGARQARTLTDATGSFRLRAPTGGRYHVRVELIGYQAVDSEPVDLEAGQATRVELRTSPQALLVEGFEVEAEDRCRVRPASGELTARLWDEVRKALTVARWGEDEGILRLRVARWRRELDPERFTVVDEQRTVDTRFTGKSPFAGAPADELQERGYVRETENGDFEYFGPDAHVLLSDVFLDSHCFRVRTDDPPEPGWVGLAFEPVERGGVPDVEGVLWVNAGTSELRRLEFDYTWLPAGLRDDRIGGVVDFERIPEGPWMVRRWAIRMPVVGLRRSYAFGMEGRQEPYLAGATETGGEVLEANLPDGSPLTRIRTATLEGTVFDSVAGGPLPGATVRLAGTDFSAVTDSAGHFRLDGLPEGSYGVVFESQRLEALPWSLDPVTVRLRAGSEMTVALAVPPRDRMLAEACRVTATENGTGVVTGRAVTAGDAAVPMEAEVVFSWSRFEVTDRQRAGVAVGERVTSARVPVAADGRFSVCGLPHDTRITAHVEVGEAAGPSVSIRLAREEMGTVEVTIPSGGREPGPAPR